MEEGGGAKEVENRAKGKGWEGILLGGSLRVLLVEHDDSTRHIVAALLRKCSYKVAAVADGLKAWEVLEEKRYKFDLILSEVVMPSLSGIDLLSRIMESEICKNIPVIMMSSHDSVSVVFKCMLKGAVDFLVKPVRKNELRNLWQHVWRKHSLSGCGNGNENGRAISYNAASNHISVNVGNKSRTGRSCDRGSEMQSSGSKSEREVESVQKGKPFSTEEEYFPMEVEAKSHNSNHIMMSGNNSRMRESGEAKGESTGIKMKTTLSINKSITTENHREENGIHNRVVGGDGDLGSKRCREVVSNNHESFVGVTDFIKVRAAQCSIPVPERTSERNGVICDATKSSHGRTACNFESSPSWELSLKRPELIGFPGHQQKHVLNHSDASPFSRYGETPIRLSCQKSGSSLENPSVKIKEYGHHCQTQQVIQETNNGKQPLFSEEESPCRKGGEFLKFHHLSSSSNQREADPIAVGPSREDAYVGHSSSKVKPDSSQHQVGFISLPVPVSAIPFQSLWAGYGSMLQHGLCPESSPLCVTHSTENQLLNSFHSIKFHHHVKNYQPHDPEHRMVDQTVNMGPQDSGAAFFVNASGSNGSNESPEAAVNAGTGPESGNEGGLQYCTGKNLNSEHSRREVALTKFRLKRKDRCFKKKVRYQTRKKLAEQRPRVKGQFVCQAVLDSIAASTRSNE